MDETWNRSAEEVLDDHLRESRTGSVEDDLPRNYSPEVVILCRRGTYHGHDRMRKLNGFLMDDFPNAGFTYDVKRVEGEIGFLEWTARAENGTTAEGADSYLIRDGKIIAQTIHYAVQRDRSDV